MGTASKPTRVDDAYEQLRTEIRTSRMAPGGVIPEPEIALHLGMSRTPVREALIRLESDGLIDLVPRRGARVRPILAADMTEIYEILTALESDSAAALASRKLSPEQLAPLEEATTLMERSLKTMDLDTWAEADDLFHRRLLELHGNRRLLDFVGKLSDQAHRARIVTLRLRETPTRSTEEHRAILEHIRLGDAEAARTAFRRHRRRAAEELLNILENFRLSRL